MYLLEGKLQFDFGSSSLTSEPSSLLSEWHLANVCSMPIMCQHTVGTQLVVWVVQVKEMG